MLNKIVNYLILLLVFFFPWQTRWIYHEDYLLGFSNEYGTLSFYGTEILLWIIVILFIINNFLNKNFIALVKERGINRPVVRRMALFVIVLIWLYIIWYFSLNREITLQFYNRLFAAVVFGIIVYIQILKESLNKVFVLFSLWLSAVVQGILGVWQFFNQGISANKWLGLSETLPSTLGVNVIETAGERWLRAYGSLGGPNPLGIFLAGGLVLGMILYYVFRESKVRILVIFGNLVILSGLFFTFSRGAWLAGVVGMVVFASALLFAKREISQSLREKVCLLFKVGLPFVALLFFLNFLFNPLVATRLTLQGRLEEKSMTSRASQISEWKIVYKRNKLVGVGPGSYTRYLAKEGIGDKFKLPVHNTYLLVLVEMGTVFAFGLFFGLGYLLFKILKQNPLYLPPLVTLLVAASFEHWPWSLFPGLLFTSLLFSVSLSKSMSKKMAI